MTENNQTPFNTEQQRKGRMVFLLMIIFFIVPIIVVVMMFRYNWKPSGESLGELIKPPRALQASDNTFDALGKPIPPLLWKEKWSIIYIADDCAEDCMTKLSEMRRLHVSLYKDIPRVQRVLITQTQNTTEIIKKYPDLIIVNKPIEKINHLTEQFKINSEPPGLSNRLYLADPLGFLMMSYSSQTPLAHVRKDVARLLKYSWAG